MKLKKFISLLLVLVLLTSPIVALASLVPETENAPYATPATTDPGDTYATPGTTEPELPPEPEIIAPAPAAMEIMPLAGTPLTAAQLPFTYTGTWDAYEYEPGKFYARFLTNGTFTPSRDLTVDVFLVGGGGGGDYGGGAGGYTKTQTGVSLSKSSNTAVIIGEGGNGAWTNLAVTAASPTYFGAISVNGAEKASGGNYGGNGGSGGGSYTISNSVGGAGGSDGSNGGGERWGTGQGFTTKAFGGDKAPFNTMLFAGGGGGAGRGNVDIPPLTAGGAGGAGGGGRGACRPEFGGPSPGEDGIPNTGGGGGGGYSVGGGARVGGGKGGSGIVIIRGVFNVAPTTPTGISTPSAVNSWAASTVTWTWNASTDVNGDTLTYPVEIAVNGGAWTQVQNTSSRSYTRTISIPNDTYYQLRVRAHDGKEYSSGYLTSGMTTLTHDTTKPTIQVVAVPDNTSYAKDKVEITVMVSDGGSGLNTLTVPPGVTPSGNQTLSGATATKTFIATANGTYTFVVTDKANLSASGSASPSKIDADNPTITYTTNPPDGEYTNGDVEITLTFSDATSGLSGYSGLNGAEGLSGNIATRSFTAGANGVYPFSVTDIVGHPASINVPVNMIDRINPTTFITPRIQAWTNAASAWFDVTATDDYSGIDKIILPDGSEHSGAATAYEIFENGSYSAYSLDKATNPSSVASANYTWFDRTKPTVRSVAFVPSTNFIAKWFSDLLGYNQHVRIEATGDDTPEGSEGESGIVSTHYRVLDGNGGVVEDWTQVPYGTKPTIDYDIHGSVEIYFKDAAGNPSDTESHEILVDLTPPVISYTLSTEDETTDPVTVTLTITDDGSGAKGFLLPDGNIFAAQAQITYTFDENDIKYFTGYDRSGRFTEIAVEVTNIVPHPLEGDWEDNQVVIDAVLHATGKRRITDVTQADMLKIIYLDLSSNQLTSLPAILANAQNLERLDLRGNEFTSIPDCVFELSHLRYLDISNNNISEISDRIKDLQHLETLDVRLNYLTDYSLPAIIPNYYDDGNFTLNGADGQYSFRFLEYDYPNEPIGNTAQLSVEWSYGGAPIGGGLEDHRKELYKSFYPLYRTYRPMLYSYTVNNGQFKTATPDYVQMVLLNNEPASATIKLGAGS